MQHPSSSDEYFTDIALNLAKQGQGWTNPNPMVGAVLVKNGKIIGQGYHKKCGLAHAEIEALRGAKTNVKGATLYLNLEPCSHYGRTPPCVDALIKAGIKKVVCATGDPNPKVNGNGLAQLKATGIEVVVGVREVEARTLNETFFTFHEKNRPFVAIKFAASLDGKIATQTGDSKWITNEATRNFARNLRGQYQAILVGVNTVLKDDPHLGARDPKQKDPIRIILDPHLRIPLKAQVLRDNNVLIATSASAPKNKLALLEKKNIPMIVFKKEKIPLKALLQELKKREIISLLVEGGGETLGNFVDAKLVDKVYAVYAPIIIGGKEAISAIGGRGAATLKKALKLKHVEFKQFGDNLLTIGYT